MVNLMAVMMGRRFCCKLAARHFYGELDRNNDKYAVFYAPGMNIFVGFHFIIFGAENTSGSRAQINFFQ